eukprot:CAMPEP_0181322778 /NCGR_PEP_ID=MMETSP1101-20121128/19412_1 /TAXON_ID=46948 /ORGANISM="Rhodomonas abbreviata, Strain Caron Lab Isolate" /LENGTH=657 /DNA_ID=CAMNT_0023430719 /DNA_START=26 /DNA_END=1999 /DNA_ORIENTATION=-
MSRCIVVGGGLSGLSAAHTILENGGRVILLDKSPFNGGNSTKATSGINAAGTRIQREQNIPDTPEVFYQDTFKSGENTARPNLIKALTYQSASAVEWLIDAFALPLDTISRLAAHSYPRTHRGGERFPGMMITYGLMEKLDEIAANAPDKAQVVNKATVTELIREGNKVVGVKYEKKGQIYEEYGPVVICTGGFGADFSDSSYLAKVQPEWRKLPAWQPDSRAGKQNGGVNINTPDLLSLPTTNGPHCTGDGLKMSVAAGAGTFDLHCVQVHPTGLVDPSEPEAKVKFLAAEALRGSGGILLDRDGNLFCDPLGKRDYVSGRMFFHNKGPYRLVLNAKAQSRIAWHIEHYENRGLMQKMNTDGLAKTLGVPKSKLAESFAEYNAAKEAPNDPKKNKWGVKFFEAYPMKTEDDFAVAIVTPLVHYCMGGIAADEHSRVLTEGGEIIPGLYTAGEAQGGVHGENRLGGSSLLDCVVFGRIAGRSAARDMLDRLSSGGAAVGGAAAAGPVTASITTSAGSSKVTLEIDFSGKGASSASTSAGGPPADGPGDFQEDPNAAFYGTGFGGDKKEAAAAGKVIDDEELAKHSTDKDLWVKLHDKIYDCTEFQHDHPGGAKAIQLYAGKDATSQFVMLHSPALLEKFGPDLYVGDAKSPSPASKL